MTTITAISAPYGQQTLHPTKRSHIRLSKVIRVKCVIEFRKKYAEMLSCEPYYRRTLTPSTRRWRSSTAPTVSGSSPPNTRSPGGVYFHLMYSQVKEFKQKYRKMRAKTCFLIEAHQLRSNKSSKNDLVSRMDLGQRMYILRSAIDLIIVQHYGFDVFCIFQAAACEFDRDDIVIAVPLFQGRGCVSSS